jgi:hypothetical protein
MTYAESAALMQDIEFRGRVKVAVVKFADYIQNEPVNTPRHTAALRWAQRTFQQPDMVATEVQPPTVMDSAVQSAGEAVTDEALQSAVESVVNKMM